jgi:hypothetical protein
MFLKEFVGDTPWIHLDIAGVAWMEDAKPWIAKGRRAFRCARWWSSRNSSRMRTGIWGGHSDRRLVPQVRPSFGLTWAHGIRSQVSVQKKDANLGHQQ